MGGDKNMQERARVLANRAQHTWEEQVLRRTVGAMRVDLELLFLTTMTHSLVLFCLTRESVFVLRAPKCLCKCVLGAVGIEALHCMYSSTWLSATCSLLSAVFCSVCAFACLFQTLVSLYMRACVRVCVSVWLCLFLCLYVCVCVHGVNDCACSDCASAATDA